MQITLELGLAFAIRTSRTLGINNVITWNDNHHKTNQSGSLFGYPNYEYLDRVLRELKERGIEWVL